MLPIIGAIGLGLGAAGAITGTIGAFRTAGAQRNIAELEAKIEAQRKQAMELDARRRSIEVVRNQQRASALGLTAATAQGAQSAGVAGSGYYGGQAQVLGQSNFNLLGISQNLEIGRNIFDLNAKISKEKMNIADSQTLTALGQGLMGFGGALTGNLDKLGNLMGNYGNMPKQGNNYQYNYGNYFPTDI